MSLIINHNLAAMNSARNLGRHQKMLGDTVRRLSSGLRVGTAADDAAGLAISELGKAKAAALAQAGRNIKDATSLVQVADRGLHTVNFMLIRMKELAEQAATGTYSADQRRIISNEMLQLVSEVERAQKDLEFNGIDIFKSDKVIEIQSGEAGEENIFINLPKTTATTLGVFTPTGQKSYETAIIDGIKLNMPQVGAALVNASQQSMADQTIKIASAADIRTIEISAAKGNNTVNGLLAEIEKLNMDGVRETSAVSYADFAGFTKAELNASYGDMVRFSFNSGGTSEPIYDYSFLIGRDEAETQANLFATLDRIIAQVNTANSDLDLSRNGTLLRSDIGRSLAIGNFKLIDNPAVELGNFGGTPSAVPGGVHIPPSRVSFDIDGIPVTFEYSPSSATNMSRAAAAAKSALQNAGLLYDAGRYATDLTYAPPHTREHYYTVTQNAANNTIAITKINLSSTEASTPAGNLLKITDLRNNQTQVNISNFINYPEERITLNIEGTSVSFTAAGTASQAVNASRLVSAVNAAGIPGITADVHGNTAVIARTGSENYINIQYDDEDNNVLFSNFSNDKGANLKFDIDGYTIFYIVGDTQTATAQNIETALGSLPSGYSVNRSGDKVRVIKTDNTNIAISNFQDDGLNNATIGPFSPLPPQGETISFTYRRSGTNYPISFIVGPSDQATAGNLSNALNAAGIPNSLFSVDGSNVRISATDNASFSILNLASTHNPIPSTSITPESGSTAGAGSGAPRQLTFGNTVTVSDIPSSILANAGHGSTGGGIVNSGNNRTIVDLETSLRAVGGSGSSNIGASIISKGPGQDIGTSTTITNSRATATSYSIESGSYLKNAALGVNVTTSFNMREDDVGNVGEYDHVTIDRINAGMRQVGLGLVNSTVVGNIDSQHSGADPDAQWVLINATGEFVLDPNISFSISSNVDGTEGSSSAGAFNAVENEPTKLIWSASKQKSKGRIGNFFNTAGETISFAINGVNLSYTAGATQSENSSLLLQELNAHRAELYARNVSYKRTSDGTGIYLHSDSDQPIVITNYSGSEPGNSGFDVWLIDSPLTNRVDEGNPNLSLDAWTSLSQINFRTQEGAQSSFKVINSAIFRVSSIQGALGADTNTLDNHAIFTAIELENTVAMVSRITDADVAIEMTKFVRGKILTEAATAMLAQANVLPKMAVQLISGYSTR